MKKITLFFLFVLFLTLFYAGLSASEALSEDSAIKANASSESTVAEMSDEQVRRLLLDMIRQEAHEAKLNAESDQAGTSAFVGFINSIRNKVSLLRERIDFLKSGETYDIEEMKGIFAYLGKGEAEPLTLISILSVIGLFIFAYIIEFLFSRYCKNVAIEKLNGRKLLFSSKIAHLLLRLGIDIVSILVFIASSLICFYVFFKPTPGLRILLAAYLSAIVIVQIAMMITRFILAPVRPELRFLPISNETVRYLYRWITSISIVAIFGLMTCGIIKISGTSEANHVKSLMMVSIAVACMLITMIFQKKKEVTTVLSARVSEDSPWMRLIRNWHHMAIFFVLILLVLSFGNILLGNSGSFLGIKSILMVPAYFIADWILCQSFAALFDLLPKEAEEAAESVKEEADDNVNHTIVKQIEFNRVKRVIVTSLRTALAFMFLIWIFNIWGLELPIGKALAQNIFKILMVILFCYIVWETLNTAIQKKLKQEMPDEDDEMEEGGAGGSRIGTLLLLLRKFLMTFIITIASMVILSSMGVDIGPLIAGAGVIGLAIGFGAQTLVKDIISGVFFLIDDAFRVGDYIEVGSTKGMVEQISLRSFKLRHPRGMVNTIPFGDISTVTNFSRDYIISKLDFRVKYGTDVEKVRKIIKKKVYKVILKNEELAPKLLGKIKSQGVRQLEDSAMIMRVKYKTIPGEQFGIRKEVFRLLQEAFREEGIEFAHRNVTVYIPPGDNASTAGEDREKLIQAGAAAAAAADAQDADKK